MIYTSGSTGQPKGVPHRHGDFIFSARSYADQIVGIGGDDRLFTASKMTFAYGLGCSLMFTLLAGASAILHPGTSTPEQLLALIARHRPNVFFAVPTIYVQLIRSFSDDHCELPMRFCGSAGERLPAFVVEAWREITGIDIVDGLGTSETNYIVISNRPGAVVPGAAGSAVPGCAIRLIDDHGNDVASGVPATCWCAARARRALTGGFARGLGGDHARRRLPAYRRRHAREGGSYFHLGRSDDMLKVGGQYVSPVTIEEVLRSHPAVADCAVVACLVGGMERPAAHLVLKPGFSAGASLEKELRARAAQLADYMRPMKYVFHDDLPRNPSGGIQRFKLKQ